MDPLALLPYALAAAGGRVGPHEVTALVAAGVTLLQRSAPLVRALAGRRAALLLPSGHAWVVALAASDGRGAVLYDTSAQSSSGPLTPESFAAHRVGAVFTTSAHAHRVPTDVVRVLLDDAPHRAIVIAAGRETQVDLGSHFGLDLEGDTLGPGAPEECLVFAGSGESFTHAELFTVVREAMARFQYTPVDRTLGLAPLDDRRSVVVSLLAPLFAGGMAHLHPTAPDSQVTALLDTIDPTLVVTSAERLPSVVRHIDRDPDHARRIKRIIVTAKAHVDTTLVTDTARSVPPIDFAD